LIRAIFPSKSQTSKLVRKAGRPVKVLRFELHPKYAWNGYAEHGVGYENTLLDFEDLFEDNI
jgi:hypothetical protein